MLSMKNVLRSAIVDHSDRTMYNLVNTIENYPHFIPNCTNATIIESTKDTMVGKICIKKAGITASFSTRNTLYPFSKIELNLVDGAFTELRGAWHFKSLSQNACKVTLDLTFSLKKEFILSAAGVFFEHLANNMIDTFCDRADYLYPK